MPQDLATYSAIRLPAALLIEGRPDIALIPGKTNNFYNYRLRKEFSEAPEPNHPTKILIRSVLDVNDKIKCAAYPLKNDDAPRPRIPIHIMSKLSSIVTG